VKEGKESMMIIIALLLLLVPGIISLRILWHGRTITKSDYKHIVIDYLVYSFLIVLLSYAFMFITYSQRTVSFSVNLHAVSHILSASFVFKYSITSLISAVGLAIVIPQIISLYGKYKHCFQFANMFMVIKRKLPRRLKKMFLVTTIIITAIAAAFYVPRVHAASYAPQIVVITPYEIDQGQVILDSDELDKIQDMLEDDEIIQRQDVEITIAGISLELDTVIYANNLRISNVWEVTRYNEQEHDNDEAEYDLDDEDEANLSIFDTELDGFDSGLRFYLPPSLLLEPGEISIVAVNNADAIISARSNSVSLQVKEVEFPVITNITVTNITDMIVEVHIYGENFDLDAEVLINDVVQNAANIYNEQNIYVYLDSTALPFVQSLDHDEIAVVVQSGEGVASIEYILTGLPRLDTTTTMIDRADWLGGGTNIIAAGLGEWNDLTNTNSREAFLHNYERGFRAFEFGTQFSADGILFGISEAMRTPRFTFLQEQEVADYTLMPFEEIVELMLEFDDWYLITNTKYHDNLQALQSTFEYMLNAVNNVEPSLLNRIVVQVYNRHMYYFMINNFPFGAYIYCLHTSGDSIEALLGFVEKNGLAVVSMPVSRATPELVESLNQLGVDSFIKSNDLHEIRDMFERGVTGVYTDFVTPNMMQHILYITEEALNQRELVLVEERNHREFIEFVDSISEDIDENYIRIISPKNIAEYYVYAFLGSVPDDVVDAFLALISLESYPLRYFSSDGYLYIDGYQYDYRIDEDAITFITFDQTERRVTEAIVFEPQNHFERPDLDFQRENNRRYFMEYLYDLKQDDFMILMSVRDDASDGLDEGMLEKLASLGLEKSLQNRHRYSYVAIINGDTVIYESISDEQIDFVEFFDLWLLEVTSVGWAGDTSSIRINGIEHSVNERGINIVVFNRRTGLVEDSVAFDTHFKIDAHR